MLFHFSLLCHSEKCIFLNWEDAQLASWQGQPTWILYKCFRTLRCGNSTSTSTSILVKKVCRVLKSMMIWEDHVESHVSTYIVACSLRHYKLWSQSIPQHSSPSFSFKSHPQLPRILALSGLKFSPHPKKTYPCFIFSMPKDVLPSYVQRFLSSTTYK